MADAAACRLVLVGGGHSHVLVLAALVAHPEPRLSVTVVSPERYTTYSGMVPGVIAGQYALRAAQIDVEALARRAGAVFLQSRATGVDPARRTLAVGDGAALPYELLSFDIGARATDMPPREPDAAVVALKPIDRAVAEIDAALATAPTPPGRRIVVVGAGAGGSEVAFALAARTRNEPGAAVTVCDAGDRPVAERGSRTAAVVERAFAGAGIRFVGGAAVERVTRAGVQLARHGEVPADLVIWATGAAAPALFAESGLPVDPNGYLLVGPDLRCVAHAQIFGAGDCATMTTHPDLPKAGVFAVRQAPVLAANLRAAARGAVLQSYRPQPRFLSLLNTGDGRAIVSYAGFARHTHWAWRLKDWIDRRFVAQFA